MIRVILLMIPYDTYDVILVCGRNITRRATYLRQVIFSRQVLPRDGDRRVDRRGAWRWTLRRWALVLRAVSRVVIALLSRHQLIVLSCYRVRPYRSRLSSALALPSPFFFLFSFRLAVICQLTMIGPHRTRLNSALIFSLFAK